MSKEVINSLKDLNTADLKIKGFKVSAFSAKASGAPVYSRRDCYKIALSTSESIIHYACKSIKIDGTYLFFGNPLVPYSAELLSPEISGYHCLLFKAKRPFQNHLGCRRFEIHTFWFDNL